MKVFLPWLRITAAAAARGMTQAPIRSVVRQPIADAPVLGFARAMLGRDATPGQVAAQMPSLARQDPLGYANRLANLTAPFVGSIVDQHLAAHGSDVGQWSDAARETVYRTQYTPPGGGHALLVVSLEPLPNAATWIADPKLMRLKIAAFPGMGLSLTPAQAAEIMRGGREVDGTPTDVYSALLPDIIESNRQQTAANGLLGGYQALTPDQMVVAMSHGFGSAELVRMQTALMVTTGYHGLDGLATWSDVLHARFPQGIVHVGFHFGDSLAPLGNAANELADIIFKTTARRQALLASWLAEIEAQVGTEAAQRLLADENVSARYHERLMQEHPGLLRDTAVLQCLDASGGALMRDLRLFVPNQVALVSADELVRSSDTDFAGVVEQGVAKAIADAYTGLGGIEPLDPAAVTPNLGGIGVGVPIPPPGDGPFTPGAPLGEPLQGHADAIAGVELPWEYLGGEVATSIREQASQAIAQVIATGIKTPVGDLVALVDTPALRETARADLDDLTWAAATDTPAARDAATALGEDGARVLVALTLSDPKWVSMTAATSGQSYVTALVAEATGAAVDHALSETSDEVEQRVAAADAAATHTSEELEARKRSQAAAEQDAAAKPDDQGAQGQVVLAEAEVQQAVDAAAAAEEAATNAHDEQAADGLLERDAKDVRDRASQGAAERERAIFGEEAR